MFKKVFLLLFTMIFAGCSVEYTKLSRQVRKSVTPTQIVSTGIDIGLSSLDNKKKNKLYGKLTKRAINVFRLYIELTVSGEKLPNKDEITSMLKFLASNLSFLKDEDLVAQGKRIAERLSLMLMDMYFK